MQRPRLKVPVWGPQEVDVDELVTVRESVHLGLFQTEIIEGWVKPLLGDTSHMMITLLRVEGQPQEDKPLPLGLHVLHAYMHLKNDNSKVSLVVRNISDSHIFLKKGVPVVQVVSASLVPPAELLPEMEAALGVESQPKPMSVAARQEKLLEKLNLDGLAHWSPENAVVARELVLAYHDVFALESNELGSTSAIKHKIHIENSELFKEQFWCIPLPLLEEVCTSLRDMMETGNPSKPITVVQCCSLGPEEGWYSAFLCQFQMPQCTDEEGFVPFAQHPGGIGKHVGVGTFLINGFQVRLLAD